MHFILYKASLWLVVSASGEVGGGGGLVEGGPIRGCAAGRVWFFYLSVLNWVYNFV